MQSFYQNFKLGVLGGGQLGRMLIQSAIDFNVDVHILDPDEHAPCRNLAKKFAIGKLTDFDTVYNFGKDCDVLTIEIENVNTDALKQLQKEGKKVFPQPEVIELIQDKGRQKLFYINNFIPTAPFERVENKTAVAKMKQFLPAVNKLRKEGYDGRGVQILRTENDLERAFDAPGILEKLIDFEKELSVIVARNESGQIKAFPVVELVFHPEHNLVEYLFAPAEITEQQSHRAKEIAEEVIKRLDMVGLLAVEMFLTKDGEILVNEIAPRTHNSGHQTIESSYTSQFEQHLRAILNMPLGPTGSKIPAAMVNLLGEDGHQGMAQYSGLEKILALEGAKVHLYGKKYTKPFRKMGHVTIIDQDVDRLKEKARFVKDNLKVIS
ncbi:5-(carboxyamino)imidazole ribonucleotide synthase [Fulvivirgaceae bacterium BMA10]|uniref:N5-carboxyaminoimidazole ribonucleotide synthase n=1 Tax=Splendidivirga corallicola TaxID=3051826 RepID=A0ABT8KM92_9BACT|nr:5-(carboxyamino)imidazole ribonucleotide synthase [Fulvivirgaceae bacterium BMA10]